MRRSGRHVQHLHGEDGHKSDDREPDDGVGRDADGSGMAAMPALAFLLMLQPNSMPHVALHNSHGGWGQNGSKGAKRRPQRVERHDAYKISTSPSVIRPVKALWCRLADSLASRLEERGAQAELAMMTPRERLALPRKLGGPAKVLSFCRLLRSSGSSIPIGPGLGPEGA